MEVGKVVNLALLTANGIRVFADDADELGTGLRVAKHSIIGRTVVEVTVSTDIAEGITATLTCSLQVLHLPEEVRVGDVEGVPCDMIIIESVHALGELGEVGTADVVVTVFQIAANDDGGISFAEFSLERSVLLIRR